MERQSSGKKKEGLRNAIESLKETKMPTPYDISGSSHFFNRADMILVIHRSKANTFDRVIVDVQKVRFSPQYGKIGVVFFDFDVPTSCYMESTNQN